MTTIEKMDQHAKEGQEVVQKVIELWMNEVLFTWRWWFGLLTTIAAWLLWIKFHKKESRYRFKSYEGKYTHIIEREQLIHKPDISVWAVQTVEPDAYIGEEIIQENFIVKNHPLSKIYGPQKSFSYKVNVSVFIFNLDLLNILWLTEHYHLRLVHRL